MHRSSSGICRCLAILMARGRLGLDFLAKMREMCARLVPVALATWVRLTAVMSMLICPLYHRHCQVVKGYRWVAYLSTSIGLDLY